MSCAVNRPVPSKCHVTPTIKDVAREAGVSIATVSHVFSNYVHLPA
ncbi:MAG: LacI family DNA-binding transcriptional regulator [Aggregatilineales bacterium]